MRTAIAPAIIVSVFILVVIVGESASISFGLNAHLAEGVEDRLLTNLRPIEFDTYGAGRSRFCL